MRVKKFFEKVWAFLHEDSWSSLVVTLVLAVVVIKFVFFPGLSLVTGTSLPLVIVESCSMHHQENGFEGIFESGVYGDYGVGLDDTGNWIFQNGFSKGDVVFVVGAKDVEVGDVIVFEGGERYPLIHRVVESPRDDSGEPAGDDYTTKGDNNPVVYGFDKDIEEGQFVGKALFKVPFIGWIKLIFFEPGRSNGNKGFCS